MGIISSFWKNRKEMDKLNDLLRQSEYLVQDLLEELEMKDSLTVKELATEDCESQDTLNDSSNNGALQASHNGALQASSSTNYDDCQSQKTEEESRSKIEAELEAELERLELSINSSTLEGKLAELDEVIMLSDSFISMLYFFTFFFSLCVCEAILMSNCFLRNSILENTIILSEKLT